MKNWNFWQDSDLLEVSLQLMTFRKKNIACFLE